MADKDLLLHDAKNCLHVLTVNLEAIEDGVVPLTKDAIRPLSQPILTLQTILTQLVEDRDLETHPEEDAFDIVPLLRDLLREVAPLFHKKGMAFEFEIKAKEVWVRADAISFERMIRNLLSNEEKYVPCGGRVKVTLNKEGSSQGVITLTDDGPGIAPQYLKSIFKRSKRGVACTPTSETTSNEARASSGRKEIPGGTGLGLYQVAQTITAMGGSLEATNRPLHKHSDAQSKETKRTFSGLQIVLSFPVDAFLA